MQWYRYNLHKWWCSEWSRYCTGSEANNVVFATLLPLMRTPRPPVVYWTDAPRWFKWTRPFRRKTKTGFCACAITFQTQSTICYTNTQAQLCTRSLLYEYSDCARFSNGYYSDVTKLESANSTSQFFFLPIKPKIRMSKFMMYKTSENNFKRFVTMDWWSLIWISHQVPIEISSFVVLWTA